MVSCSYCSVELRDQYNLKNHHKANHQCKFCGTVFGQKDNLKMHQKICSKNKKAVIPCTTCGKSFSKYSHKVEHESICGIKKVSKHIYECCLCYPNRQFANNTNLVNHLKSHEKEKSYTCKDCPKSFSTQVSLSQHEKLHNNVFWCNICPKKISTKQGLQKHWTLMYSLHN